MPSPHDSGSLGLNGAAAAGPGNASESVSVGEIFANLLSDEEAQMAWLSATQAPRTPPVAPVPAPPAGLFYYDGVGGFLGHPAPLPSESSAALMGDGRAAPPVLEGYAAGILARLAALARHGHPDRFPWPLINEEMSLEEFLMRAGVIVAEGNAAGAGAGAAPVGSSPPLTPQHSEMTYQAPAASEAGESSLLLDKMFGIGGHNNEQKQLMAAALATWVNGMAQPVASGYGGIGSPLSQTGSSVMGGGQGEYSAATMVYGVAAGGVRAQGMDSRKRQMGDDAAEKRQKRMMKNRESAAKSRARKQAYTSELEEELTKLRIENLKLLREKKWMMNVGNKMLQGSGAGQAKDIENKASCSSLQRCKSSTWNRYGKRCSSNPSTETPAANPRDAAASTTAAASTGDVATSATSSFAPTCPSRAQVDAPPLHELNLTNYQRGVQEVGG